MKMKVSNPLSTAFAVIALAGTVLAPSVAQADQRRDQESQHRQNKQNEWRNLTIGSAAVAVLGLATHNKALTAAGAAGALYSGYRLSQDGKGSRHDRDWQRQNDRYRNDQDWQRQNDQYRNDQDWQRQNDQYRNTQYSRNPHANPDGRMIARYDRDASPTCNTRNRKSDSRNSHKDHGHRD